MRGSRWEAPAPLWLAAPPPQKSSASFCTNLAILTRGPQGGGWSSGCSPRGGRDGHTTSLGATVSGGPDPPFSSHSPPLHFGFRSNFLHLGGGRLPAASLRLAASPLVSALMIPTAIGEGVAVARPPAPRVGRGQARSPHPGHPPPQHPPAHSPPPPCPRKKQ